LCVTIARESGLKRGILGSTDMWTGFIQSY
jgi:hypothetical protein